MGAELRNAAQEIYAEAEKLYFHGLKLHRYLENNAIIRLEDYLEASLCYELSTLAMLLLNGNKTSKICRGDYLDGEGKLKTHHSWVEFEEPSVGWCVLDLAWFEPAIIRKEFYFQNCNNLISKWDCSYNEFWNIQFAHTVLRAMKQCNTSYVLMELSAFGDPKADSYKFRSHCYKEHDLVYSDGTYMLPHRFPSGKVISSRIMRDFVKNPDRKAPKQRSVRLAEKALRIYENS